MTKAIVGGVFVTMLALIAIAVGYLTLHEVIDPGTPDALTSSAAMDAHPSFLYGRVTINGGATYEGRLRWGRAEEAFWGDYFNGVKNGNTWATHVPPERLLKKARPISIFGIEITKRQDMVDIGRPFMARFGDISRIEMLGRDVRVTLKSGTVFDLDYYAVNDFADGVRVWDVKQGVVDLDSSRIHTVDFLSAPPEGAVPHRLHGTVRTRQGDFTGFLQWDRNEGLAADEFNGRTADGDVSVRFDTIRSITRESADSAGVTLLDGRKIVLSEARETGGSNLGVYVDDRRYGRVLISWDAFERVDFSPGGSGPAYSDFPSGQPITGSITTRDGRRLAGRLVYDLDESETTETLDAPLEAVTYNLPFGMIASIVLPSHEEQVRVTLHNGEELQFERGGDLGDGNLGMLIFIDGSQHPEYVPWIDVKQVDVHRPLLMYPPQSGR